MSAPEFDGATFAKRLNTSPGVYLMRDEKGKSLYVGKAKNLRKRVASYFDKRPKNTRTMSMVEKIRDIEVSLTRTEGEALLLENEWIKSLKPRYNILLRDDKSYPYISLSTRDEYPRISFHRGAQRGGGRFFGPFPSAASVRESIGLIQKLFRVRTCEDSIFQHRSRPCLQHQIKRCTAPCVGKVDQAAYGEDVRDAVLFLEGKNDNIIQRLVKRMETAAAAKEYERAADLRDQVQLLRQIQARQFVSDADGDADIIAVASSGTTSVVQMVSFRGGRNLGQRSFFPANSKGESHADILQAFLGQYYQGKVPPPILILSDNPPERELFGEVLSRLAGRKVRLIFRPRGSRAQWLKLAKSNAENAIRLHQAARSTIMEQLDSLAGLLKLPETPEYIECFDISHSSGKQTVGSCVVFSQNGPQNSLYRRFNLKNITPGDDYAAMRQVLQRRYQRLVAEHAILPDLIIVDGGKGQLRQAIEVINELGISEIPVLGIAKGPGRRAGYEEWVLPTAPFRLNPPPDSSAAHLVQQIRDEAHRFAITGHRSRRQKVSVRSGLESLPGIGSKRRRSLLQHFGGLQGVKKAGVEELAGVPGISRKLAEKIYLALHGS